jgi:dTDP-glucose 4,6-dehydratase
MKVWMPLNASELKNVDRLLSETDLSHVLEHTASIWDSFRGARILLTGGTGFFGTWLIETFSYVNRKLGLDANLVVLDRNPNFKPSISGFPVIPGDVRHFVFPEGKFTHVIHTASPVTPQGQDATADFQRAVETYDVVIHGMKRVLDFAVHSGANRVLFTSSGAIYGPQPSDLPLIDEGYRGAPDPLSTRNTYGESKRLAEHLCALYHSRYGIEPVITRGFSFVGPLLPLTTHFAIGNFLGDALRSTPIRVKGDGTAFRSYLYAADLAIWLWTFLARGEALRPYNVGSSRAISIGDLARKIAEKTGTSYQIEKTPLSGAKPARYVPSVERAEKELGLKQWIDLDGAIERTLAWHRGAKAL